MNVTTALRAAVDRVVSDKAMPDLSMRQLGVLMRVADAKEPLSVRELAEPMKISKPAVTRAIDRLEHFAFVERRQAKLDRRLIELRITAAGRAYLAKLDRAVTRTEKEVAAAA